MEKDETGITAGDADQQPGNNDATADGQQSDTQSAAENQEVEGLKAAAVAEREKRQAAEADRDNLRDQMALQAANQQVEAPAATQESLYIQIAKQFGYDPEYMTPAEQGRVNEAMVDMKVSVVSSQMAESAFLTQHPDYVDVVGELNATGQFIYAPPLTRALKANPALASALRTSPNRAVLAYEIAKNDPQYLQEKADKGKSADVLAGEKAAAKVTAANKQLSASAATGGGSLDQGAAIAGMTDEQFAAHNEKVMAKAQ